MMIHSLGWNQLNTARAVAILTPHLTVRAACFFMPLLVTEESHGRYSSAADHTEFSSNSSKTFGKNSSVMAAEQQAMNHGIRPADGGARPARGELSLAIPQLRDAAGGGSGVIAISC